MRTCQSPFCDNAVVKYRCETAAEFSTRLSCSRKCAYWIGVEARFCVRCSGMILPRYISYTNREGPTRYSTRLYCSQDCVGESQFIPHSTKCQNPTCSVMISHVRGETHRSAKVSRKFCSHLCAYTSPGWHSARFKHHPRHPISAAQSGETFKKRRSEGYYDLGYTRQFTPDEIALIRNDPRGPGAISKQWHVVPATIRQILNHESYKDLPAGTQSHRLLKKNGKMTRAQFVEILNDERYTHIIAADKTCPVGPDVIRQIKRGIVRERWFTD